MVRALSRPPRFRLCRSHGHCRIDVAVPSGVGSDAATRLLRALVTDGAGTSIQHLAGEKPSRSAAGGQEDDTRTLSSSDAGLSLASFADWSLAASLFEQQGGSGAGGAGGGGRPACTSGLFRWADGAPAGFALVVTGGRGANNFRLVPRAKSLLTMAGCALAMRKKQGIERLAEERATANRLQRRFLVRR